MTVTRDATSLWYRPASLSEWTTHLAGSGFANPKVGLLLQDASGNPADSLSGGIAFTASGSGRLYQQTVAGHAAKGIKLTPFNGDKLESLVSGLPDVSTTSILILLYVLFPSYPSATNWGGHRSVVTIGPTFNQQLSLTHGDNGVTSKCEMIIGSIVTPPAFTVVPQDTARMVLLQVNRATGKVAMTVDSEDHENTLSGAVVTGKGVIFGGDNVAENWAGNNTLFGAWIWTGTDAETITNATDRAALISRMLNGAPDTVSIAVSPDPVLLAIAGQQQMHCTGTRPDTSTYDATGDVTWDSSNPAAATISAGGLVTAMAPGTTTITATLGALTDTALVTVSNAASKYARMMQALLPPGKVWKS